jgi:uncharacterized protein (TIGR00106 family)
VVIHRVQPCADRPIRRSSSQSLADERPLIPTGPRARAEPRTWCRPLSVGRWRETQQMIAAFSITPIGAGESVSELVAECVSIVRESGLPNETNPMFTNIEGEWDEVMRVIKQCVDHVAVAAPRISVVIKIDQRRGVSGALRSKVESVERRLSSK